MRVVGLPRSLFLPALISMVNSRDEHSMVSSRLKRGSGGEGGASIVYNLVTSPLFVIPFV